MAAVPRYVQIEARKELARRYFYDYCRLKYPTHYSDDRPYLKVICERIQAFVEQNDKRFLVITVPPRHYKSFTGGAFVEWDFGKRPHHKVMTGSYNEVLSTTFARKVRDTIDEKAVTGGSLVYNDIFPATKVKYGQASASLWALEGSSQDNYLATSPTGTATGFGANIILIDDIIKNAEEAYNDAVLDKEWSWFTNTMLSRTEGADWKVIVIMTRWATNDLAGRILSSYEDVEHISYSAVQEDGSMLCDDILTKADYLLKTKEMNMDIVEANYNQKPVDIKGRLYDSLLVYEQLPMAAAEVKRWNYTDTADKGTDWLCSVDYVAVEDEVYILDVVMSDAAMEITEPLVADMLFTDKINEAIVESNNGGRGFARNIKRLLTDVHNSSRTVLTDKNQTSNKEARILSSSAWVKAHVHFPLNWQHQWPDFYKQIMAYQKKGNNRHDDAVDVLAGIYETVTSKQKVEFGFF